MNEVVEKTIGQIVADDYRTASIFKKHNIDFCCKGGRTIEEACSMKNINPKLVEEEINALQQQSNKEIEDYHTWSADVLIDHILAQHHKYVEQAIQQITPFLDKVSRVHGDRHPELIEIRNEFMESAGELTMHMKKEELILFPHIKKMALAGKNAGSPPFGTVNNPISMMMQEHETEGDRFRKISALSNNYTPPEDACNTYRVTFFMLKEYEEDLHLHIHLENNILFPMAIEMEKELGIS